MGQNTHGQGGDDSVVRYVNPLDADAADSHSKTNAFEDEQPDVDFWARAEQKDTTDHGHDNKSLHHIHCEACAPSSTMSPDETHDWEYLWAVADVNQAGYLDRDEFDNLFEAANKYSSQKRSCFDFHTSVPLIESAAVDKLWDTMVSDNAWTRPNETETHNATVSKETFLSKIGKHEGLFDTLYQSFFHHAWEEMWEEADSDGSGTLAREEVVRMFRLANERDHGGTSARIITYDRMRELWEEMTEHSADGTQVGTVTQDAFLYSVRHNPRLYGTIAKATYEKRTQDSVATGLVGVGSALTLLMLVYVAVSTKALEPLLESIFGNGSCSRGSQGVTITSTVVLIAFVVGMPILVFVKIYQRRELVYAKFDSREQMRFKLQWGWIYTRYRPQAWWWEATIILHKLLWSILVIVFASDPESAPPCLALFQIFFISLQLQCQPYSTVQANSWDVALMVLELCNILPFISGSQVSVFFEFVLVVANATPILVMLLVFKYSIGHIHASRISLTSRLVAAAHAHPALTAMPILFGVGAIISIGLANYSTDDTECLDSNCTECPANTVPVDESAVCRTCVPKLLSITVLISTLGIMIPGSAYLMNVFQKWMALNHSVDNHAKDLFENAATTRELGDKLAKFGALISHLQLTRLCFSLDLDWPPVLLSFIRIVTAPFAFNLDLKSTFKSFCYQQLLNNMSELLLLVLLAASMGLCSIALAYWPNRHAVENARAADLVEHEKIKKRLYKDFLEQIEEEHHDAGYTGAKELLLSRVCKFGMACGLIGGIIQVHAYLHVSSTTTTTISNRTGCG